MSETITTKKEKLDNIISMIFKIDEQIRNLMKAKAMYEQEWTRVNHD